MRGTRILVQTLECITVVFEKRPRSLEASRTSICCKAYVNEESHMFFQPERREGTSFWKEGKEPF